MRSRFYLVRPLILLALPCWLAAGPLAGIVKSLALCRHHAAVHHSRAHNAQPSDAPCYCAQMTGGLHTAVAVAEVFLAPASIAAPALDVRTIAQRITHTSPPASHTPAPTPPPPNEPVA